MSVDSSSYASDHSGIGLTNVVTTKVYTNRLHKHQSWLHGWHVRQDTPQQRLGRWLESESVHRLILAALIVDFIVVMAEILYTMFEDHNCDNKHQENGHDRSHVEVILTALELTSLSIVSLFVVELTLKVYCFGIQYFTRAKVHIFDALVVLITFTLMLCLHDEEEDVASLLILLRFWRVIRVIDAVAVGIGHQYENELEEVKEQLRECRAQLRALRLKHKNINGLSDL